MQLAAATLAAHVGQEAVGTQCTGGAPLLEFFEGSTVFRNAGSCGEGIAAYQEEVGTCDV